MVIASLPTSTCHCWPDKAGPIFQLTHSATSAPLIGNVMRTNCDLCCQTLVAAQTRLLIKRSLQRLFLQQSEVKLFNQRSDSYTVQTTNHLSSPAPSGNMGWYSHQSEGNIWISLECFRSLLLYYLITTNLSKYTQIGISVNVNIVNKNYVSGNQILVESKLQSSTTNDNHITNTKV